MRGKIGQTRFEHHRGLLWRKLRAPRGETLVLAHHAQGDGAVVAIDVEIVMQKCFVHLVAANVFQLADALVGNVFAKNVGNGDDDDNGLGKLYKWKTVSGGFFEAKKTRKPIIVVVHRLGCPACDNLRPKFASSLKLIDLSKHFVMVNVESPANRQLPLKLAPDGAYIPRILFFSPDGKLLRDIINQDPERDPEYKYHYWSIGPIIDSMIRVLKMFPQVTNAECLTDSSITTGPTFIK